MFVLDTDTLTLVYTAHPKVIARRASVSGSEIAITVVTRIEVLQGRFDFLLKAATVAEQVRAQERLDATETLLASIPSILPLTEEAAEEFQRLRQNKKLKKIGRADLLIAAITMVNGATLVTRNLKDFRQVPGLLIENWAD
jgi:tRNA(fMet)-specific endonuclease VapC